MARDPAGRGRAADRRRRRPGRRSGRAASGRGARCGSCRSSAALPATVVIPRSSSTGRGAGEGDRQGIVVAGIAVEDDRPPLAGRPRSGQGRQGRGLAGIVESRVEAHRSGGRFALVGPAVGGGRDAPADQPGQDDDRRDVGQRAEQPGTAGPSRSRRGRRSAGRTSIVWPRVRKSEKNSAAPNAPSGVQRPTISAARAMNPRPATPSAWNEFDSSIERNAPPSPAKTPADQDVPVAQPDDVDPDRLGRLRMLADRPRPEAPARAEQEDLEDEDADEEADRDRPLVEDRPRGASR